MEPFPHPRPAPFGSHLLAFVVRLAVSAAVLWMAVGIASPANPANTFGQAVLVSIVLSIAYYITLAKFLWFLLLPWLLYAAIWLFVVMSAYGIGFWRALLVALALTFLSWAVSAVFGIRTFRSE
jgi:putative membrane protein